MKERLLKEAISEENIEEIICKLNNGINSEVYKVKARHYSEPVILKFFKEGSIGRFEREEAFLKHCAMYQIRETPKIIRSNHREKYMIQSWIKGDTPKYLRNSENDALAKFVETINKFEFKEEIKAADSLENVEVFIKEMERRKESLIKIRKKSHSDRDKFFLAIEDVINGIDLEKEKLALKREFNHWKPENMDKILSPSDVGIHNMLKNSNGYYFLDFEYSGIDDLSKLAADWICGANTTVYDESRNLIEKISETRITKNSNWKKRLEDIKPLTYYKWIEIMAKKWSRRSDNKAEKLLKEQIIARCEYIKSSINLRGD